MFVMEDAKLDKLLNTRHAAELLDISPRALLFRVQKGCLEAVVVGTRLYFTSTELRRYQLSLPRIGRKENL